MRMFNGRIKRVFLIGAIIIAVTGLFPIAQARPPLPPGWAGPNYYWHGRYWHNRYPAYDRRHRRYWRYR